MKKMLDFLVYLQSGPLAWMANLVKRLYSDLGVLNLLNHVDNM